MSSTRRRAAHSPRARADDSPAPSDEDLLAAFVGGDRDAFGALMDRHAARVYAICYRYFRDVQDAEDAAQEAFVTLYRRAETFSATAKFSTWMYRLTTNTCNDIARKRARRPRTVPLLQDDRGGRRGSTSTDPDRGSVDDALASVELAGELRRGLSALDPDQRRAVILHDVLGLPYADIAERTGVAVGTVKSRIHRGHARLTDLLAHLRNLSARQPSDRPEPTAPSRPPTS